MGIQLGGLSSGMDTTSLISQLMEAERKPVYQKQNEIAVINQSKQIWTSINSQITSMNTAASDLKFSTTFGSKSVSSSNDLKIAGTATSDAAPSTYVLENVVMASSAKVIGDAFATYSSGVKANVEETSSITDANQRFNTGTDVKMGSFKINGKLISVQTTDTINMVLSKINASTANVVASFDNATGKLKMVQKDAGVSKKIEIDAVDSSGFLTAVGYGSRLGTKIANGLNADNANALKDTTQFAAVTDGFFSINGQTFEVKKDTDTLSGLLAKINSSSAGVNAFFDTDTKKVTLTSKETGTPLTLENDTSGFLASLNIMNKDTDTNADTGKSEYKGTDASFIMNGVSMTKTSNKFTVNGVTFDLKGATTDAEKLTITVKNDTDKALSKIKAFIEKYNQIVSSVEEQTAKDAPLQGDTMATGMMFNLRTKLMSSVTGVDSAYSSLSMIGITAKDSRSSTLTIDETKVKAALEANPAEVKNLFVKNEGAGIASGEVVGTGNGTNKAFKLLNIPANTTNMEIKVGTTVYSTSSSTNKIITSGTPTASELFVDMVTGKMTFGTAPASGAALEATYNYDNSNGSSDGIGIRISKYLKPYTAYNGTLTQHIKSYDSLIKDANSWIASMETRLSMREESLKKQFGAMESAMQKSSSQGSWLSSQVSSLG